jgi:phosphomannomutase
LRPSNTEPLLRLNVESADESVMQATVAELAGILEEER